MNGLRFSPILALLLRGAGLCQAPILCISSDRVTFPMRLLRSPQRRHPAPVVKTNYDLERIAEAQARPDRRAAKRTENQRRCDAGKLKLATV